MAEFWTWPAFEMAYTCTEMARRPTSMANIVGAEAFTETDRKSGWRTHRR